MNDLRLKIDLKLDLDVSLKFWYYADLTKIKTINELRKDILRKYFSFNEISNKKRLLDDLALVKLSVDNFDLPLFESTHLLRESDLVEFHLISKTYKNNLKRKLTDDSIVKQPLNKKANLVSTFSYDVCLIGTSMIKNINANEIFSNKKCYFKSISGGKIKDILLNLKSNENLLKNSKCFLITCGSNDVDSLNDMKTTINDFLELAQYLHSTYESSQFIFNKLIPRTKCRYVSLIDFDKRRICFNDFLQFTLPLIVPCKIVEHESFENKTLLNDLLADGVHISPSRGLPLYVDEIKKVLFNLQI